MIDDDLARRIIENDGPENPVRTFLSTNQRVIARVTDGIYRQPGSALRELVSNAYDADAETVTIKTDAPRFEKVTVEDDGLGMSPAALAHLLQNIGGSAKRTDEAEALGISAFDDSFTSPGGRPLIGKLGIGLFSVSQLTRAFQIITKVQGDPFRTIAVVRLTQFSDSQNASDETPYQAGEVLLWREPSERTDEHGTTIVLTAMRPQTREALQSRDIWDAIDDPVESESKSGEPFLPRYHIGRANAEGTYMGDAGSAERNVPWEDDDSPSESFKKMVDCVWDAAARYNPNPKLSDLFDNYLKMIWDLGLALPLDYVEGHLFDEPADGWAQYFRLSNGGRGSTATEYQPHPQTRIRELMGLTSGLESPTPFRVFVDELELSRPIKFRQLPPTNHAIKTPLVFLGQLHEEFEGYPVAVSAGTLSFEAYFFWTPKVAPVDHRGALIRIHNSSGSLFDESFFRYQVSEQTRLRQITCEIFVSQGLESALNIDREAFNTSHPHMVVLTKWVHGALRQIATAQKRVAQTIRVADRSILAERKADRLKEIVELANEFVTDGEGVVPRVILARGGELVDDTNVTQVFDYERLHGRDEPRLSYDPQFDDRLEAMGQVLSIYGVFDHLTADQGEELMHALAEILRTALE